MCQRRGRLAADLLQHQISAVLGQEETHAPQQLVMLILDDAMLDALGLYEQICRRNMKKRIQRSD